MSPPTSRRNHLRQTATNLTILSLGTAALIGIVTLGLIRQGWASRPKRIRDLRASQPFAYRILTSGLLDSSRAWTPDARDPSPRLSPTTAPHPTPLMRGSLYE
jgi:hypothetical protein